MVGFSSASSSSSSSTTFLAAVFLAAVFFAVAFFAVFLAVVFLAAAFFTGASDSSSVGAAAGALFFTGAALAATVLVVAVRFAGLFAATLFRVRLGSAALTISVTPSSSRI